MFIGEKLIYLQLPKTACTHIAAILADNIPGEQIKKHNILTDYIHDQLIIGSVRNPWDWYVSLWSYGCEKKGDIYSMFTKKRAYQAIRKLYYGEIAEAIYEAVKPTHTWRKTYSKSKTPDCFRKWLKMIYDPNNRVGFPKQYHKYSLCKFAGYYTHRYALLHFKNYYKTSVRKQITNLDELIEYERENNLLDFVIRTESLEDDLIKTLKLSGYNSPEIEKKILESRGVKTNKSQHKGTGYYYDEETAQLVADNEQFIIDKFGYKPPELSMS